MMKFKVGLLLQYVIYGYDQGKTWGGLAEPDLLKK